MSKKIRDANATKERIIQKAIVLFSKKGFDASSVDEIAKACEVNKALLYYYYKNKAGLYEAVMNEALSSIHKQISQTDKCCDSPLAELQAFIYSYSSYTEKHPYFPSLLLRELSSGGKHIPDTMFTNMRCLFKLLSDILKDGEEKGIFKNVIPMVIYFMIVGTLNLLVTTKNLRVKAEEIDEVNTCSKCTIEEISDYIFHKTKLMLEVRDEENIKCS